MVLGLLACHTLVSNEGGAIVPGAEEERYIRFSSGAAEYVFEYPAGWQVENRLTEPEPQVGFIGPTNEAGTFAVVLFVSHSKRMSERATLDSVMHEMLDAAGRETVRFLTTRTTEIDGKPSRIVVVARDWRLPISLGEVLDIPVVERYLLIKRDGWLYTVIYVAPEELDGRFAEVFERVIGTFRFRSS